MLYFTVYLFALLRRIGISKINEKRKVEVCRRLLSLIKPRRGEIPNLTLVPGEIDVSLYIASGEGDLVEDATRLTTVKSDFYGTGIVPTKGVFLLNNGWSLAYHREEIAL
jgi:hypothetical protein